MRIVNESTGQVLAEHAELATSTFARMKGLLGRSGLEPGTGIVIDPCNSIHTFFMRFAIDVIFLDVDDRVLRICPSIPPWRVTRIHARARSVIELPSGSLIHTGTKVGDRIVFVGPS